MAGARIVDIMYVDTQEIVKVMLTLGDTIRAQDWASTSGVEEKFVDQRAGLYACFLGAKRQKLRGTEGDWLDWMDIVTIPDDDEDDVDVPESGESAGPPSGS